MHKIYKLLDERPWKLDKYTSDGAQKAKFEANWNRSNTR